MAARLADPDLAVAREAARALVRLRWRVPGTVAPLLALLERAPPEPALDRVSDRASPGWAVEAFAGGLADALADALAIMAAPADDAALAAALRRLPTDGRRVVARALAAAHAAQPISDGALVDLLVASLAHEPAEAEAAADALALARGVRGRETAVLRAFEAVAPDVRPHLCNAVAALGGSAGREQLIAIVADAGAPADVRAAAAWALPAAPDLRRDDLAQVAALRFALTRASTSSDAAVAANAHAALAALALPAPGAPAGKTEPHAAWTAVRLRARDGAALPHAWLSLTRGRRHHHLDAERARRHRPRGGAAGRPLPGAAQGPDAHDGAALDGSDGRELRPAAMTAAMASGRSPATMPRPPIAADARSPARPCTSTPRRAASNASIP